MIIYDCEFNNILSTRVKKFFREEYPITNRHPPLKEIYPFNKISAPPPHTHTQTHSPPPLLLVIENVLFEFVVNHDDLCLTFLYVITKSECCDWICSQFKEISITVQAGRC